MGDPRGQRRRRRRSGCRDDRDVGPTDRCGQRRVVEVPGDDDATAGSHGEALQLAEQVVVAGADRSDCPQGEVVAPRAQGLEHGTVALAWVDVAEHGHHRSGDVEGLGRCNGRDRLDGQGNDRRLGGDAAGPQPLPLVTARHDDGIDRRGQVPVGGGAAPIVLGAVPVRNVVQRHDRRARQASDQLEARAGGSIAGRAEQAIRVVEVGDRSRRRRWSFSGIGQPEDGAAGETGDGDGVPDHAVVLGSDDDRGRQQLTRGTAHRQRPVRSRSSPSGSKRTWQASASWLNQSPIGHRSQRRRNR